LDGGSTPPSSTSKLLIINYLISKVLPIRKYLSLFFKILLFPFSLLYDLVTYTRNHLYDRGIFHSATFPIFTISVGNLTVGGTGKTPHIEYLIRYFLKSNQQITFLSRGYGRKTRGVIMVNQSINLPIVASTIGDEPKQIFDRFGSQITVCVGEKRALAIPQILQHKPNTQVILLDDAYQHRAVNRDINILLTDYYRPFYRDFLLPTGRLRESRHGAQRADIIFVTKCPPILQSIEKEDIKKQISKYTKKEIPIFFTTFQYGNPTALIENMPIPTTQNLLLVTGIADTTSLLTHLKSNYQVLHHFEFADHYDYTEATVNQIISTYHSLKRKQDCIILTTEKDKVKLLTFKDLLKNIPFFYIPIEVAFLERENEFWSCIA
jgi:tetraacyldisaccharide 4'-kinase